MNIDIIAGERVAPCIAHDAPFASDPVWVRYETGQKRLCIIFEDGAIRPIPTAVNDDIAQRLRFSRKIMLVQLRDGRPIEGFECRLRTFDEVGNELATA